MLRVHWLHLFAVVAAFTLAAIEREVDAELYAREGVSVERGRAVRVAAAVILIESRFAARVAVGVRLLR